MDMHIDLSAFVFSIIMLLAITVFWRTYSAHRRTKAKTVETAEAGSVETVTVTETTPQRSNRRSALFNRLASFWENQNGVLFATLLLVLVLGGVAWKLQTLPPNTWDTWSPNVFWIVAGLVVLYVLSSTLTKNDVLSAAFPVILMWGVAVWTLKTLSPHTWNTWSSDGFWIATGLVIIYALSRTWTKKADGFVIALFVIAVVMVVAHETPMLRGLWEKGIASVPSFTSSSRGSGSYMLAHGETSEEVIPPYHDFNFNCVGDISFSASWRDDRGNQYIEGSCGDLARGHVVQSIGLMFHPVFRFTGGQSGGTVYATITPAR